MKGLIAAASGSVAQHNTLNRIDKSHLVLGGTALIREFDHQSPTPRIHQVHEEFQSNSSSSQTRCRLDASSSSISPLLLETTSSQVNHDQIDPEVPKAGLMDQESGW
jgi:hypothetical protein